MPKLKTHKGAAKRFKKTATGKIMRRHSFARHILTTKSRSRKRRLAQSVPVDPADIAVLRKMLPY
jgi:large subunit ribosomal protein L35